MVKSNVHRLNFVSSGSTTTTGFLKLASLGSDIRLGCRVGNSWSFAHVSAGFSALPWTLHQECILACRALECQLIQSKALASSFHNPCAGSFSEAQGKHSHLGNRQKSYVISNCANNNNIFVSRILLPKSPCNSGERDRGLVCFAH